MEKDFEAMKDYFAECTKTKQVYEEDLTIGFMKIALNYIALLEAENQVCKGKERILRKIAEENMNKDGGTKWYPMSK